MSYAGIDEENVVKDRERHSGQTALSWNRGQSTTTIDPRMQAELAQLLEQNGFRFVLDGMARPLNQSRLHFMSVQAASWRPPLAMPKRDHLFYHSLKRFLDIAIASAAILILLPIMIAVALAIAIEDGHPFVYHQVRTGRFGQSFRFYKFRSMVRDADKVKADLQARNEASGPIFKMRNDPRVTRTGRFIRKTSLDELPQFFSVLRGEMSLIGPRPLYAPEAAKLSPRYGQRHRVQPGLLCLREVCGRSELTFEQWMELDLIYVQSQSLRTDLTIMLRAIPAILSSHGAY